MLKRRGMLKVTGHVDSVGLCWERRGMQHFHQSQHTTSILTCPAAPNIPRQSQHTSASQRTQSIPTYIGIPTYSIKPNIPCQPQHTPAIRTYPVNPDLPRQSQHTPSIPTHPVNPNIDRHPLLLIPVACFVVAIACFCLPLLAYLLPAFASAFAFNLLFDIFRVALEGVPPIMLPPPPPPSVALRGMLGSTRPVGIAGVCWG